MAQPKGGGVWQIRNCISIMTLTFVLIVLTSCSKQQLLVEFDVVGVRPGKGSFLVNTWVPGKEASRHTTHEKAGKDWHWNGGGSVIRAKTVDLVQAPSIDPPGGVRWLLAGVAVRDETHLEIPFILDFVFSRPSFEGSNKRIVSDPGAYTFDKGFATSRPVPGGDALIQGRLENVVVKPRTREYQKE